MERGGAGLVVDMRVADPREVGETGVARYGVFAQLRARTPTLACRGTLLPL